MSPLLPEMPPLGRLLTKEGAVVRREAESGRSSRREASEGQAAFELEAEAQPLGRRDGDKGGADQGRSGGDGQEHHLHDRPVSWLLHRGGTMPVSGFGGGWLPQLHERSSRIAVDAVPDLN